MREEALALTGSLISSTTRAVHARRYAAQRNRGVAGQAPDVYMEHVSGGAEVHRKGINDTPRKPVSLPYDVSQRPATLGTEVYERKTRNDASVCRSIPIQYDEDEDDADFCRGKSVYKASQPISQSASHLASALKCLCRLLLLARSWLGFRFLRGRCSMGVLKRLDWPSREVVRSV